MKEVSILILLCLGSLWLTACHSCPLVSEASCGPLNDLQKRSSEAEIRQHITGIWTQPDSDSLWPRYQSIQIAEDGGFWGVLEDGTRQHLGTWELVHSLMRVNKSATEWDYYPVVYAGDHELILTPGISVAGRARLVK
jgi:hypothetical protein